MDNILKVLTNSAKERVIEEKKEMSLEEVMDKANKINLNSHSFYNAIKNDKMSFICEVKKASPSKGIISKDFDYIEIAKAYEKNGANAISVLTEPTQFLGSEEYLKEISQTVSLPCLKKDFLVDEYQIYKGKLKGASCVLLICSILTDDQLEKMLRICRDINMDALVETRNKEEIEKALYYGGEIIGINNRNLKDFTVDISTCEKLRQFVPSDKIFVGESGIKTNEDIKRLEASGIDCVLVGEALMRGNSLKDLRGDYAN